MVDVTFTQMTTNKGDKLYGEKAVAVIFKEYKQMNERRVFERITLSDISNIEKREAFIDLV